MSLLAGLVFIVSRVFLVLVVSKTLCSNVRIARRASFHEWSPSNSGKIIEENIAIILQVWKIIRQSTKLREFRIFTFKFFLDIPFHSKKIP